MSIEKKLSGISMDKGIGGRRLLSRLPLLLSALTIALSACSDGSISVEYGVRALAGLTIDRANPTHRFKYAKL